MELLTQFSLTSIWNSALVSRVERNPVAREYLWASQLNKPHIDLWLAMRGEKPSNIPNDRSKRKFFAGDIHEYIVYTVLMLSGVAKEQQEEIWTDYGIKVKGKGDFILSGKFDFSHVEEDICRMNLPDSMKDVYLFVARNLKEQYEGFEFEPTVYEIKSVAERTMSKIEKAGKPLKSHILQTTHYKLGRGVKDAVVAVLCRDDMRLFEYHITAEDEQNYINHVKGLVEPLRGEKPPLAPKIVFDEVLGKFSKNLDIEYSSFLTLLYGYERPDIYSDETKPIVARWNRVLPRIKAVQAGVRGKPTKKEPEGKLTVLTDKNLAAIEEMKAHGHDAYKLSQVSDIEEEEEG